MSESPPVKPIPPPRTVRLRTAAIVGVVLLLVGVGIGAASKTPAVANTDVAAASPSLPAPIPTASVEPESSAPPASATPTPEPTATPTQEATAAPAKPVVVRGTGTQKTKPFSLQAGDFTVVIAGSGHSNVIADLLERGGSGSENLFNEISSGKYKYDTVVYGLPAGSGYYLDVTNEGSWVVTFTPLA